MTNQATTQNAPAGEASAIQKLAADSSNVIQQGQQLLERAVDENNKLSAEIAQLKANDDEAIKVAEANIEKLCSLCMPGSNEPILPASEKAAWLESIRDPSTSKLATATLIDRLVSVSLEPLQESKVASDNGELGEVADPPRTNQASGNPERQFVGARR